MLAGFVSMNGPFFVLSGVSMYPGRAAGYNTSDYVTGRLRRPDEQERPHLSAVVPGRAVAPILGRSVVGLLTVGSPGLVGPEGQLTDPSKLARQSIGRQPTDGGSPYRGIAVRRLVG